MRFERGFSQYFTRSDDGETFRLRTVELTKKGKIVEAKSQEKWVPKQAKAFAKYCRNNNVPSAQERLTRGMLSYLPK